MAFSGKEFIDVLDTLCRENGTTISAFLLSIGKQKSLAGSIKQAKSPNRFVVEEASKRFGVSVSWLLGESVDQNSKELLILTPQESELICCLRRADESARESVYKMAAAVLATPSIRATKTPSRPFLPPNGDDIHRTNGRKWRMKSVEGDAAAGLPIEAVPDGETRIPVPVKYLADRYFIVRARGDSMTGSGIEDGDFCVFDSQAPRDDGDVMLIFVDGSTDRSEGAIKRVYYLPGRDPDGEDARVRLVSTNSAYEPMVYPASEVVVTGVLADVLPGDNA